MNRKTKIKLKSFFDDAIKRAEYKRIEASVFNQIHPNKEFQKVIKSCNEIIKVYMVCMEKLGITEDHQVKFKSGGFVSEVKESILNKKPWK